MHVSVLVNGLRRAGAERQVGYLARALADDGRHVEVLTLLAPSGDVADLIGPGIDVIDCSAGRGGPAGTVVRLARHLRSRRPRVLISFLWQANVAGTLAARAAGVDTILSIRNDRFPGRWREPVLRLVRRWSIGAVANSERAAAALGARGVLDPARTRVVANAVELHGAADPAAARARLRAEWGVGADDVVWINVARLEPQKDHDNLFAAFAAVRADRPTSRLVIAGDGSRRAELAARAPEGVALLGERSDVAELLAAADGFVLSSRWEGQPNVVLEAMAAGLAVVATDAGGTGELVADRVTGRLVPIEDPTALAAAMRDLAADPAQRTAFGDAGRARVERHDPARIAVAWRTTIDELLGEAAPSTTPHRKDPA